MNLPTEVVQTALDFDHAFSCLTGHGPFPWQRRLYRQLREGTVPTAVDIPTGLGKTAVMACWLLARASCTTLPRRLIYVVDRRVVVDQATKVAEDIRDRLDGIPELKEKLSLGGRRLPISTLRGQHLDNKDWLQDPASTAIIVGTVDMIGSRLLFSGYGVSRKMRPNAAGLLGCDSLVVLDEAHLSRPFEQLLRSIERERSVDDRRLSENQAKERNVDVAGLGLPPQFRVLPLSATLGKTDDDVPFRLDAEDNSDPTVARRLNAPKTLWVKDIDKGISLDEALADATWELYLEEAAAVQVPLRLLVYCHSRDAAEKVASKLKLRSKNEASDAKTILFTGGRRAHERQRAADELIEYGLIGARSTSLSHSVILVATSAGEVGVDLDADHMVCDLVPLERMVQRLGRVNRRGTGAAKVHVIDGGKQPDDAATARLQAARRLLSKLPLGDEDGHQAGPGALAELGRLADQDGLVEDASTPSPPYPALAGELLEAWSMTSLAEHTGRPEVGPWLRGWQDEEPQTSVAWRRFLPLRFRSGGSEANIRRGDIEAFFEAALLQTAEILEAETWRVADWLKKRVRRVVKSVAKKQAASGPKEPIPDMESESSDSSTDPLFPLSEESVVASLPDGDGKSEQSFSLKRLADMPAKELNQRLAGRRLVLDARLGGIQDDGFLDPGCDTPATTADGWEDDSGAEGWGQQTVRVRLVTDESRVNDSAKEEAWLEVLALPYVISDEGDASIWLVAEKQVAKTTGEDSLAVAPASQELEEHQQMVAAEVARIADELDLDGSDQAMLVAAARMHDAGKGASRWQRAFNARAAGGPYAKTSGPLNLSILNGYRHEFQSVVLAEREGLKGMDRSGWRYELALHLIAAHHGNARPVIGVEGCDILPPTAAARHAREIAVRFARLQSYLGPWGLAWWESLLRAADRRASMQHEELHGRQPRKTKQESRRRSNGDTGVAVDTTKKGVE